jgi:hypothetical protein
VTAEHLPRSRYNHPPRHLGSANSFVQRTLLAGRRLVASRPPEHLQSQRRIIDAIANETRPASRAARVAIPNSDGRGFARNWRPLASHMTTLPPWLPAPPVHDRQALGLVHTVTREEARCVVNSVAIGLHRPARTASPAIRSALCEG